MEKTPIINEEKTFNSKLSLKLLVDLLKKSVAEGNAGSKKLYGGLIAQLEAIPELLQPQEDDSLIRKHSELVEMLLATVFPPTATDKDNLYAVSFPFRFNIIYSSPLFQAFFMKPGTNEVDIPETELGAQLAHEKLVFAYNIILKKYFDYEGPETTSMVYPFVDAVSGLTKYLELNIDARFIEVHLAGEMPKTPDCMVCKRTNQLLPLEQLMQMLPLEKFVFEGMSIVRVNDVTGEEVISRLKSDLLDINAFSSHSLYQKMQTHIQSLLGLKNVEVGLTPFFKLNDHYLFSEKHTNSSLLYKQFAKVGESEQMNDICVETFRNIDHPLVFETLTEEDTNEYAYLKLYYNQGVRSLLMCPLKKDNELIGVLEIVSAVPGTITYTHIDKISPAIPYFRMALEKGFETLLNGITRVIKEQFTAVQPSVEWKFTEAALNYIVKKKHDEEAKIERITFDHVYPVFGSIDIRNSSVERAHSIQLDLVEQLQMTREIIRKAHKEMQFPLFQEIEFKIEKYISSVSDMLLSDEEVQIREFLSGQVQSIFNHIKATVPALTSDINKYYASLDPQSNMIYKHRKEYEDSISKINSAVSRFIDKEQSAAQKVYPHYFERYVTDGVEFNIYIGQSIAPRKKFDEIYLRNMKIWQLTVLARAAKLTYGMESELALPLRTTQLILAHSIPLSISFRTAERKFDVDGAYNIRYEIVKKRIDKVRIKDTNERLTQPGKIAIVYSQAKEANEYMEYIEFLQNQKLLKGTIEKYDLEELQGVSGLKALRVEVNLDDTTKTESKVQLSNTTSQQLLGK